jgi:hypothetical protein
MRPSPLYLLAALGLLVFATTPARGQDASAGGTTYNATVNCSATPTGHLDWPATNPIWSMDFVRPANSSGSDGSGLELRNVYYRGYLVFKRAHAPILNVEYDGGCGCYRDWSDSEAGFFTDGIRPGIESCFADATPGVVQTTCDSNMNGGQGGDTGSFRAIAAEDYGDELVLTTHMSAGWYRYRIKWHFYTDGRIWPEYSFSAASATCTNDSHRHHTYWRFDFDLLAGHPRDGEDQVYEVNPALSTTTRLTQEASNTWGNPADGVYWAVYDASFRAGYRIVPSSADLQLPVDDFSKVDMLAVRYVAGEYDDGSFSCPINPGASQLDNNESLTNQDIVFWYRSGALHPAGNPWECDIVGPTLLPFRRGGGAEGALTAEDFALAPFGAPSASAADEMAAGYELDQARPNPFNPTTTVRFRVADAQPVTLALYDALGRRVAVLFEGRAEAGRYESVRVDGSSLPAGAYTVVLEGETVRGSTRVVLLK